jgi:hypothetical protein
MCFYTLACFKIKFGGLISIVVEEVMVVVMVVMVVMVVVMTAFDYNDDFTMVTICECRIHSNGSCKHYSCKYSHSKDCYFLCFIHI